MNRSQANELRAGMGLPPLPAVADKAGAKKRQAANAAARAAANRAIKDKRSKGR